MDNSNNKERRKPHRRFSNEFKEEAVKLSQKIGVKETAKRLGVDGIAESTFYFLSG